MDRESSSAGRGQGEPPPGAAPPAAGRAGLARAAAGVLESELFLPALILAAVAVLWAAPLWSGLWRDEATTWWVVKDGLGTAVTRAERFQPWYPLYVVVEWAAVRLLGGSEACLRLPSLAAGLGSAAMLYLFARRLLDRELALLAVLAFAASQEGSFAAADARPYSLALFFMLAGLWSLGRALDEGRPADWAVFALSGAAMFLSHHLFAPALAVALVFALSRLASTSPAGRLDLAVAWAGVGLGLAACVPRALDLLGRRESLAWAGAPQWAELGWALAAPALALGALGGLPAAAILGLGIAKWDGARAGHGWRGHGRGAVLAALAAWAVLPPLGYFALAHLSPLKLFTARYMLWFVPGRSLLFAWLLRGIEPAAARRLAALFLLGAAFWSHAGPNHSFEDLKGASRAIAEAAAGAATPVLVQSPFVESNRPDWLSDRERLGYLFTPLEYYPAGTARVIPLPMRPSDPTAAYLERLAAGILEAEDRFLLAVLREGGKSPYHAWVEARLGPAGFRLSSLWKSAGVAVLVFERAGTGPSGRSAKPRAGASR